ncbi:hypothetical protein ACF06P_35415 [Streptomyces sp. NPDC015684]|uniref:hypothetical protein n=1 Tax=Streptomyces sp. NPDC015684 TaxID=3364963 RepID=UPI0036FC487A
MKAVDDRYKAGLIDEYQSYVRAKRTKEAEGVAQVLRDQYDYDVDSQDDDEPKEGTPESTDTGKAPENTAASSPPEAAVEPKPQPAGPDTKPAAAKKTAAPAKKTAAPAKKTAAQPESK